MKQIELKLGFIYLHEDQQTEIFIINSEDSDTENSFPMGSEIIVGDRKGTQNKWNKFLAPGTVTEIGPKEDYPEYFL